MWKSETIKNISYAGFVENGFQNIKWFVIPGLKLDGFAWIVKRLFIQNMTMNFEN